MNDQTTIVQDKLALNIANSWKMYSVRFVSIFSAAVTALLAWFAGLPADCAPLLAATPPHDCTISQLSILSKFGATAAIVPIVAGAIAWYLRVRPQANITPDVAAAKSIDAEQPGSKGV